MKKLFLILSVALFALGTVNAFAQEAAAAAETHLSKSRRDAVVAGPNRSARARSI